MPLFLPGTITISRSPHRRTLDLPALRHPPEQVTMRLMGNTCGPSTNSIIVLQLVHFLLDVSAPKNPPALSRLPLPAGGLLMLHPLHPAHIRPQRLNLVDHPRRPYHRHLSHAFGHGLFRFISVIVTPNGQSSRAEPGGRSILTRKTTMVLRKTRLQEDFGVKIPRSSMTGGG